jgi:hypothetical protein
MTTTWYSVTVEAHDGGQWQPVDPPCTQVSESSPKELAAELVAAHCLAETDRPWRVRIYAGYNRYEDLLFEQTDRVVSGDELWRRMQADRTRADEE